MASPAFVKSCDQAPAGSASQTSIFTADYDCPLGLLRLSFEGTVLTAIDFPSSEPKASGGRKEDRSHPTVASVATQLDEYFAGKRTSFDFTLRIRGTPFEERVWTALTKVPHGATVSYAQLAQAIGSPGAARAVGGAVGRNPLPICVPCHRVIAADGSIGGFSGGLPAKRRLLAVERIVVKDALSAAKRRRQAKPAAGVGRE